MKKLVLIALVAFVLLLAGCTQPQQSTTTNTTGTSGATNGTTSGANASGTVTTGGTDSGTSWCPVGASWNYSGTASEGYGSASWIIKGIESFKGGTYCHATYTVSEEGQGQMTMDAYFNKDSKDVWIVVRDATGKQISESHVTGS